MNLSHDRGHARRRRAWQAGRAAFLPRAAAVVLAAAIFALVYPPFDVGPLAFLALAPVALVFADPRQRCSIGGAAACGFAFGWLASMAIVGPWMISAARDYFEHSTAVAFGFALFVNAAYVAAFYAPTFAAVRAVRRLSPWLRAAAVACVWTAFEVLRAEAVLANPWALLGQGLHDVPLLREASAFGGVALLSFAAALTGSSAGVALQLDPGRDRRELGRLLALALAGPFGLAALGHLAGEGELRALRPLRVAVVQAEIASKDLWDPSQRMDHWNTFMAMTSKLEPGSTDLVVWPENAVPFLLDADVSSRTKISRLAILERTAILLGAPRSQSTGDGEASIFNSVYFFAPDGRVEVYDKRRLLPFVETMPPVLAAMGTAAAEYSAGREPAAFEVAGWRVEPLICFEAVYPGYARDAARRGADLLVNVSNDAWFAGGGGPEQHHAMSILRASDTRLPMVRVSNGGLSGAIAAGGAAIAAPIARERGLRIYEVEPPPREIAPYARADLFSPAVVLAAIAFVIFARRQERETSL